MSRYLLIFLSFVSALSPFLARADAPLQPIAEIFEPEAPPHADAYTKVAVIQWAPSGYAPLGDAAAVAAYKQNTREQLAARIREAAENGAGLILTPEFGLVGYPDIAELPDAEDNFRNRDDIAPYVETIPGDNTAYFGKLANELGVYIHVGMVEVDAKTNAYYNAAVALGPDGEIAASYRKMELFEAEHHFLSSGEGGSYYDAPFGRVGLLICADVYSSEPIRGYVKNQVGVLALSTSWARMNSGWGYFTRAAQSSAMFLLAANMPYYPDSGVINPDGTAQSHIRQTRYGTAYGYIPNVAKTSKHR
jgi:predicted amidohydrolase